MQGAYSDADLATPAPTPPPRGTTFTDADLAPPRGTSPNRSGVDPIEQLIGPPPSAANATPAEAGFFSRAGEYVSDLVSGAQQGIQLSLERSRGVAGPPPDAIGSALHHPLKTAAGLVGINADRVWGDVAAGNLPAAAGDLVIPAALAALPFSARRMQAVRAARAALPNAGRLTVDLIKAAPPNKFAPYSPLDVQRAIPYLADQHSQSPIASLPAYEEGLDSGVRQIEMHIDQYIAANPTATIRTNPLATARAILAKGARSSDVAIGLKELDDLGLQGPMTLADAEKARVRLNAENKANLKRNKYDVATALESDPAFRARDAASAALRDGIYDELDARGIPGVRELRRDEGSLIKLRTNAQHHIFSGDQTVAGSGANSVPAKLTRVLVPAVGASIGAEMGGPHGAITGGLLGNELARRVVPPNLTRDALIERAFKDVRNLRKTYPQVPPPAPPPAAPPLVQAPWRPTPAQVVQAQQAAPVTPVASHPVPPPAPPAAPAVPVTQATPPADVLATSETPPRRPGDYGMALGRRSERQVPQAAPLSSLGTTLETSNAAPTPPASPAAAGPGLQNRPVERAAPAPVSRPQPAGGRGGGAPEGSTANVPKGYEGHFQSLVPFARKNGFTGRTDDLAKVYRERIDEAQEINRASEDSPENDDRAHRTLLQAVADAGGIGIEANTGKGSVVGGAMGRAMEGGSKGEVTALLDMLERMPVRGSKPGAARQVKPHMRAEGTVGDIRGVIKRTGGETLDHILESLHEGGRFQHLDSTNDLLDAVREAIFHETQGPGTPSATSPAKIQSTLEYLGVTRDNQWWLPRPPEEFSFDEKTP